MIPKLPFFLLILVGCSAPISNTAPPVIDAPSPFLIKEYVSCTGKGKIDSHGPIQGALTFSFMSQHDSSFFQFKDLLGRKALLMWLTERNVTAWNLVENKQYTYNQILEFFPFLQIVEPLDITKFLWGITPDYDKNNESALLNKNHPNIRLNFEKEDLAEETNALVSANFVDEKSSQSVRIRIKKRTRTQTTLDLKRVWKLLRL